MHLIFYSFFPVEFYHFSSHLRHELRNLKIILFTDLAIRVKRLVRVMSVIIPGSFFAQDLSDGRGAGVAGPAVKIQVVYAQFRTGFFPIPVQIVFTERRVVVVTT